MRDDRITLVVLGALLVLAWWGRSPTTYRVVRARYPVDVGDVTTAIQTETTWRGSYFTDMPRGTRLGKLTLLVSERRESKPDAPAPFREFDDACGMLTLYHNGRPYEFFFQADLVGKASTPRLLLRLRYEAPKPHPLSMPSPTRPLNSSAPPIPMVPAEATLRVRNGQLVGTVTDAHEHLSAWVELEPDFPVKLATVPAPP